MHAPHHIAKLHDEAEEGSEFTMDNRGPQVDAIAITMVVLCTLAVALRFLSRVLSKTTGIWWDDWAALAALVRWPPYTPVPQSQVC